jgi:SAM-dependent methyltransferase
MDEPRAAAAPLYALDPTRRFSDRADDYTRFRPTYPPGAIDAALHALGPAPLTVADVGAGTGISSRLLAERGHRVLAIEPNAAMARAAEPDPGIAWIVGAAEATTLPAASVDLVLCAQSFHWFRPIEAARELARILRPGGRLALIWNVRDDRDPFTAAYSSVMDAASHGQSVDRGHFDREGIEALGLFTPFTLHEFGSSQVLDRQGVLGRALSASYFPKQGARREPLLADLDRAFSRHARDGAVRLAYITRVWLADLR